MHRYIQIGVCNLHYDIYARVVKEGEYMLENTATVRATANHFGLSKSTVHTDLTKRLKRIDENLYRQVKLKRVQELALQEMLKQFY